MESKYTYTSTVSGCEEEILRLGTLASNASGQLDVLWHDLEDTMSIVTHVECRYLL